MFLRTVGNFPVSLPMTFPALPDEAEKPANTCDAEQSQGAWLGDGGGSGSVVHAVRKIQGNAGAPTALEVEDLELVQARCQGHLLLNSGCTSGVNPIVAVVMAAVV